MLNTEVEAHIKNNCSWTKLPQSIKQVCQLFCLLLGHESLTLKFIFFSMNGKTDKIAVFSHSVLIMKEISDLWNRWSNCQRQDDRISRPVSSRSTILYEGLIK